MSFLPQRYRKNETKNRPQDPSVCVNLGESPRQSTNFSGTRFRFRNVQKNHIIYIDISQIEKGSHWLSEKTFNNSFLTSSFNHKAQVQTKRLKYIQTYNFYQLHVYIFQYIIDAELYPKRKRIFHRDAFLKLCSSDFGQVLRVEQDTGLKFQCSLAMTEGPEGHPPRHRNEKNCMPPKILAPQKWCHPKCGM